jgi:hypothetical protein
LVELFSSPPRASAGELNVFSGRAVRVELSEMVCQYC